MKVVTYITLFINLYTVYVANIYIYAKWAIARFDFKTIRFGNLPLQSINLP